MKTFQNLIDEVQQPGYCHHCGGCVTFCTAVNYAALVQNDKGLPQYSDQEKCIECGLCYAICPEIDEIEEDTRKLVSWTPPIGQVLETHIARAKDPDIVAQATDGGVVTGILLQLLSRGHIDGAIVTRQTGPFMREPSLATTPEEIIAAAGFYFDSSHGMKHLGQDYSTYSPSVQEFRPMVQKGLRRVAMVGTPCQIKAVRRMETLGIVPSDSIKYTLGLFCSGNFMFGEDEQKKIEKMANFSWDDMKKVNVKDQLMIHLKSGKVIELPISELDFMKRYACQFCSDYSAEFADISFGGIGADEGWTTLITRTPEGRKIFADARKKTLNVLDDPSHEKTDAAIQKITQKTAEKQARAKMNRDKMT
ncbi:MAG: Coenzyme F420 hydrogenase subunit beta [Candidatus Magnetoglobus multicellularis str. Araruama]|uniref:Coenzyme F420 hydrogenase subunit beta n=1 Tax=Candidatus Magnetoglobus multicellularis str. Araruama TaxID=890399 RepID=A0A1V1PB99_9BACT|nr:MAG: Coenzyme F420 hydrogenase subunit beta [Candidatus Magnetoglobus multicellularis str. Araruama]